MDLAGKVAFITGAARGIGKEIVRIFVMNGAHVALCDINKELLEASVSEMRKYKSGVEGFVLDVSDMKSCEEVTKKVIDTFGQIDILVNNAGITRDNVIIRMSEEDFDKVININLKGTFNCIKIVSRVMMKQRSGNIINIASVIGLVGNFGQANYAASKAGVIGITKSAARELASRNIRVNAVAPGYIQTEMTAILPDEAKSRMIENIPLKRAGEPSDVANAVLFLASDYSSYITGQVLVVDGGMVM